MKPSSDQIRMQRWWTLQHKIEKNIVKIPHWMAFFNYKKVSEPLTWIFSSNENPAWNKILRGFELTVGLYPDVAVVNVYDTHSARSSATWSSYDTLMSQRSPLSENEIENFLNSVFNTEHIIVRKTQPNRYHSRALNAHIRKEIEPYQWVLLDQSDVARQAKQVIAHQAWKNSLGSDTVKPSK